MDWDDTPSTLDAELFEECGCDDGVRGSEGVGVKESTTDYANEDDGETTTENLRAVSDHGSTGHGAEICDNLCYGDGIGTEIVLVRQHGWVDILGTVGLKDISGVHRRVEGKLTMKLKPAIRRTR
jgi:hypothetical protein